MAEAAETEDTLLGGRVRLRQPRDGYRVAIDPVLLAAAVPARAGDRVLDVGLGSGAAALCLAARVQGVRLTGVERDMAAIDLARRNAAANGVEGEWLEGDVLSPSGALLRRQFDHVMSNPPYRSTARARPSPHAGVAAAHAIDDADFAAWLAFCAGRVRSRGTLSLVLPAGELARALAVLAPRFGAVTVLPIWPRVGRPATRVVLRARRARPSPAVLAAGLVLHGDGGGYTTAAEAVLWRGAALEAAIDRDRDLF
jgi:tRNA1(Val) A37 N6-methylase TrmN6